MIEPDVTTSARATTSDIQADFVWIAANRAPEVTLSFYGSSEPEGLWASLRVLGWVVPPCPPPPSTAIEWIPDPTTGADFTIHPWKVKDFRLRPGAWSRDEERVVGAFTIKALQAYNVTMSGLRGEAAAEAIEATSPSTPAVSSPTPEAQRPASQPVTAPNAPTTPAWEPAAPPANTPVAPDASAPSANTASASTSASAQAGEPHAAATQSYLLLVVPTLGNAVDLPAGIAPVASLSGREQTPWAWGATSQAPHIVFEDPSHLRSLVDAGGHAWKASAESDLPPVGASGSVVQMVVPGGSTNDKRIGKMLKMLGDSVHTVDLEPVDSGEGALLVWAQVAASSAAMLASNLRLRIPDGIIQSANIA